MLRIHMQSLSYQCWEYTCSHYLTNVVSWYRNIFCSFIPSLGSENGVSLYVIENGLTPHITLLQHLPSYLIFLIQHIVDYIHNRNTLERERERERWNINTVVKFVWYLTCSFNVSISVQIFSLTSKLSPQPENKANIYQIIVHSIYWFVTLPKLGYSNCL